jgi:hypothetical protein
VIGSKAITMHGTIKAIGMILLMVFLPIRKCCAGALQQGFIPPRRLALVKNHLFFLSH